MKEINMLRIFGAIIVSFCLNIGLSHAQEHQMSSATVSDGRLTTNVHSLPYGLKDVMNLRPVSFELKTQKQKQDAGRKLGLITQETAEVMPEVVQTAEDAAHTQHIAYGDVVPVLVQSIQELKTQNDSLNAKYEALLDRVKMLEGDIVVKTIE